MYFSDALDYGHVFEKSNANLSMLYISYLAIERMRGGIEIRVNDLLTGGEAIDPNATEALTFLMFGEPTLQSAFHLYSGRITSALPYRLFAENCVGLLATETLQFSLYKIIKYTTAGVFHLKVGLPIKVLEFGLSSILAISAGRHGFKRYLNYQYGP